MQAEQRAILKKFALNAGVWLGLALGAHILTTTFLESPVEFLVPGILLLGGLQIGLLDRTELPVVGGTKLKRAIALFMIATAVWLWLPPSPEAQLPWQPYSEELLAAARQGGRKAMIDFSATWCPPCQDMEHRVFTRRKVVNVARDFMVLKMDMTDRDSTTNQAVAEKFQVEGLPTVVFLGPDGKERTELRLVGYEEAGRFVRRLAAVK